MANNPVAAGVNVTSSQPPVPLSPDGFDDLPSSAAPTPATQLQPTDAGGFTRTERTTLTFALELLRSARTVLAGSDAAGKEAASRQVDAVVAYLLGFCDSRGLTSTTSVKPGFEATFGAVAKPSRDEMLDELESSLQAALDARDTRTWREAAHAVGDVMIAFGVGLILL